MELTATSNYGPIRAGKTYRIVATGPDWYLVRHKGGTMYVFKWAFAYTPQTEEDYDE
jgi:hypothetical protein